MIIRCSKENYFSGEDFREETFDGIPTPEISYEQLFMKAMLEPAASARSDLINVNLILVDSVSRNSFYRSLPKTTSFLDDLVDKSRTDVLDFKFVQSIKHRTYENLEALFSGFVDLQVTPFGTYDIPKKPLPLKQLFMKYKRRGYATMFIEDLCWNWEWGLVKDLKVMNTSLTNEQIWRDFTEALRDAGIDTIGSTPASCHILRKNDYKDPFHAKRSICFNGRYHHDYSLEYLKEFQVAADYASKPTFTFTGINIAHEETGLFIQNLDEALRDYIKFSTSFLPNTLTIVFSDHGSTYGKFIESTPEAYVEMYNPFMFLIIPEKVGYQLGSAKMQQLRTNTERLITLIDVHYTLVNLLNKPSNVTVDLTFQKKYVQRDGLFSDIDPYRMCSDLPLLQPNLCICQNFEMNSEPSVFHDGLAEYALGVINSNILEQRGGYGYCLPYMGAKVRKVVQIRVAADLTHYKLDVIVRTVKLHYNATTRGSALRTREYLSSSLVDGTSVSSTDSPQLIRDQLFFFVVQVSPSDPQLTLVSYERMSSYAGFKRCCDQSVELKLCTCHVHEPMLSLSPPELLYESPLLQHMVPLFRSPLTSRAANIVFSYASSSSFGGIAPTVVAKYPLPNVCAFVYQLKFKSGVVLYGLNTCSYFVNIEVSVVSKNVYMSIPRRVVVGLESPTIKMIVAGVVDNPRINWSWTHRVWFTRL